MSAESKHFLPAILVIHVIFPYRIYTVYSDWQTWANCTGLNHTTENTAIVQGLYCLPFNYITFRHIIKLPCGLHGLCIFAWLLAQFWLIACFPFQLHDDGSVLRLNDGSLLKSFSDGRCLTINVCGLILVPFVVFLCSGFRSPLSPLQSQNRIFLFKAYMYIS